MPITWLDILLLGVMLISGLLAMIRGFMREILSIAAWGLAALHTLPAACLSAGQRRRLSLCRLAAVPRPVWLLDEPTAALDAAAQVTLGEVMGAHLAEGGIIVAATHGPLPIAAQVELSLVSGRAEGKAA